MRHETGCEDGFQRGRGQAPDAGRDGCKLLAVHGPSRGATDEQAPFIVPVGGPQGHLEARAVRIDVGEHGGRMGLPGADRSGGLDDEFVPVEAEDGQLGSILEDHDLFARAGSDIADAGIGLGAESDRAVLLGLDAPGFPIQDEHGAVLGGAFAGLPEAVVRVDDDLLGGILVEVGDRGPRGAGGRLETDDQRCWQRGRPALLEGVVPKLAGLDVDLLAPLLGVDDCDDVGLPGVVEVGHERRGGDRARQLGDARSRFPDRSRGSREGLPLGIVGGLSPLGLILDGLDRFGRVPRAGQAAIVDGLHAVGVRRGALQTLVGEDAGFGGGDRFEACPVDRALDHVVADRAHVLGLAPGEGEFAAETGVVGADRWCRRTQRLGGGAGLGAGRARLTSLVDGHDLVAVGGVLGETGVLETRISGFVDEHLIVEGA